MRRAPTRSMRMPAITLLGGGALAAVLWIDGQIDYAVTLGVLTAIGASVLAWWGGRDGDASSLVRGEADERVRSIDRAAMAFAALVMVAVSFVGAVVSVTRDGAVGPYGVLCAVGGVAYLAALAWLSRRR